MFVLDPKKLKKLTLSLVALIASSSLALQLDWVQQHVQPLLVSHPHLSSLGTGLVLILTILHNPKAQNVIKQAFAEDETTAPDGTTKTVTTEVVVKQDPPTT